MSIQTTPFLSIEDYNYQLPDELIARYPLEVRSASQLLQLDAEGVVHDKHFIDLPDLLNEGDLLVFNDTKVMKARLFGNKDTGGKVEILIERLVEAQDFLVDNPDGYGNAQHIALCHVRSSKAPKYGQRLNIAHDAMQCTMVGRHENLFILAFDQPILPDLEKYGELPIPPYFERHADETDNERYQTVFHDPKNIASVAAPTASLHFDDSILQRLADKGINSTFVTLNVGAGTFAPVKTDNLLEHTMHSEYAHLPAESAQLINETKARGNKVIAVGTTVTRVLETAYQKTVVEKRAPENNTSNDPDNNADNNINNNTDNNTDNNNEKAILSAWSGDTDIFIYPSFEFGVVDRLITNFHLPKSTLLMLVSALAGKETVMNTYQHAIKKEYRFFSYGDSMLIDKINIAKVI